MKHQTLSAHCVFPLITGEVGPAMRDLRAGAAQQMLDEEDLSRGADPR